MKKKTFLLLTLILCAFWELTAQCPTNILFYSQAQIDDFATNYPGCTEILGYVAISENSTGNIINLNGLLPVTSIGGYLHVSDNDALTNLGGLDSLTSIGGFFWVSSNDALINLSGLDNVTSIGGDLTVIENASLNSLSGLDNIDYSTITGLGLAIQSCPNLSVCEINSVCDYVENGGPANISGNAAGCNNVSEIVAACLVPVEEIFSDEQTVIQISPNPTNGIIQINGNDLEGWEYNIRNTSGMLFKSYQIPESGQIDLSQLPSGLFFLEIGNKDQIVVKKIIKE